MHQVWLWVVIGAGLLLVLGLACWVVDAMQAQKMRVRERLDKERQAQTQGPRRRSEAPVRPALALEQSEEVQEMLDRRNAFVRLVEESGLAIWPRQLLAMCGAVTVGVWFLIFLILGRQPLAWMLAIPAGFVPVLYVCVVRSRRQEKLLSQLPEAFDLMSRTLRSGQTFSHALQAVGDEFPSPIAEEFGYCHDQEALGLSSEAAMRELARRTGLLEVKIFAMAVSVHQQTGGNFAQLLDKLGKVLRERYRIRGMIKALTAEGRFQGLILIMLPPGLMGALLLLNRPYIMLLFDHPGLLIGTGVSMLIGGLWINKIVKFDF